MAVFSLKQNLSHISTIPVTTLNITFGALPVVGNLLCLAGFIGSGLTSIHDDQGNNYTLSPHSPLVDDTTTNVLAYLIAPANRGQIVTVAWTTPQDFVTLFVAEFSYTSVSVAFDKDAVQTVTNAVGTEMSFPSITPTNINSLLFAYCNPTDFVVTPASGDSAGPWIGLNIDNLSGIGTEYDPDSSAATRVNFTNNVSEGVYRSMVMAFSPVPSTPIPVSTTSGTILKGPHRGSRMTPPYNP